MASQLWGGPRLGFAFMIFKLERALTAFQDHNQTVQYDHLAILAPTNDTSTIPTPDHGRKPPNSGPNHPKPNQHPHKCLRYQRRCRRHRFGHHSSHNHR
eukprot:scaffold58586_cov78-Cyclotella_meneghiniana.AAC.2